MKSERGKKNRRRAELLMPAGSLEKLKTAVLYGADAIYMGTPDMSLRTRSDVTLDDVVEGVEYAHSHGKRVYLTLNLFAHNKDIVKLPEYLETVRKVNPDGLIVADPGVFDFVRQNAPDIDLHISTQANVCSWLSVDFWKKQGAALCVLAREVSFAELCEIREKCPDIKLEAFIHGAMCMTYSGRCMLSNFMAERGANQGNCANSCRWNYKIHLRLKDGTLKELAISDENRELFEFLLEEGYRPGDLLPFEEDERGSYILNSKDLCMMPKLGDYLALGIDSLKVEGRNKSLYYVAVVARAYRMAIDEWYENPDSWNPQKYMRELEKVTNRGYTYAFHEGRLSHHSHNYDKTSSISEWEFAGQIVKVEDDAFHLLVKNRIMAGDVLEFLPPRRKETVLLRIYEFEDAKTGQVYDKVHAGQDMVVRLPFSLFEHEEISDLKNNFPVMSVVRKEKALTKEEWCRIKLDRAAQNIELGKGDEKIYKRKRDELIEAIDKGSGQRSFKSPRFGVEGCCGRGCNGCLVFWYDDAYKGAREMLAKKRQGEKLERNMVDKTGKNY